NGCSTGITWLGPDLDWVQSAPMQSVRSRSFDQHRTVYI
ncbi:hypothetical protein A2U01_0111996, partial [Trifolium medium]|nr:hypothetical protein [Trifolium medium]